jgi:lysozyme|tara:strand:- start:1144 stop:1590 length:447 start_codon:yes stop_codon:yes gene_type:complete
MATIKSLEDLLSLHEGVRLKAYDDATGKTVKPGDTVLGNVTIGIGRNLIGNGITTREMKALLKNDIIRARKRAERYKWFSAMNPPRQAVIVSLIFNMGNIDSFVRMRAAIAVKDWETSAMELLDSKYSRDVGDRCLILSDMLRSGKWP